LPKQLPKLGIEEHVEGVSVPNRKLLGSSFLEETGEWQPHCHDPGVISFIETKEQIQ